MSSSEPPAQHGLESRLETLRKAYADLQEENVKLQKKNDMLVHEVSTLREFCLQNGLAPKWENDKSNETDDADDDDDEEEEEEEEDDHLTLAVPSTPPSTPTHHYPPQRPRARDPRLVELGVTFQIIPANGTGETEHTTHCFQLNAAECSSIRQFCQRVAHAIPEECTGKAEPTGAPRSDSDSEPESGPEPMSVTDGKAGPEAEASRAAAAAAAAAPPPPPSSSSGEQEEVITPEFSAQIKSTFYPRLSATRFYPDLSRATIKLEEDGHVAEFTVTPTTLDKVTPWPELQYHAWYERNIVRGRGDKAEYMVNVKMRECGSGSQKTQCVGRGSRPPESL